MGSRVDPWVRRDVPIACSLDDATLRRRLGVWAGLAPSGRLVDIGPDHLRLEFPAEVAPVLTELVEAERRCCGFVDWELFDTEASVTLTVTGDEMGIAAIRGQFLPELSTWG